MSVLAAAHLVSMTNFFSWLVCSRLQNKGFMGVGGLMAGLRGAANINNLLFTRYCWSQLGLMHL